QLQTREFYTGVGAVVEPPPQCSGPCKPQEQQQKPTTLTAKIVGVIDTSGSSKTIRVPLEWMRGMEQFRQYQMTEADQKLQQESCKNSHGPCNPTQHYTLITKDMLTENGYGSLIAKVDSSKNASAAAAQIRKLGVGAADA